MPDYADWTKRLRRGMGERPDGRGVGGLCRLIRAESPGKQPGRHANRGDEHNNSRHLELVQQHHLHNLPREDGDGVSRRRPSTIRTVETTSARGTGEMARTGKRSVRGTAATETPHSSTGDGVAFALVPDGPGAFPSESPSC